MFLSGEGQRSSGANSHPRWRMQGVLMNMLSSAFAIAWIFFPLSSQVGLGLANCAGCVTAEGEQLCQLEMNQLERRFQQCKSKILSYPLSRQWWVLLGQKGGPHTGAFLGSRCPWCIWLIFQEKKKNYLVKTPTSVTFGDWENEIRTAHKSAVLFHAVV